MLALLRTHGLHVYFEFALGPRVLVKCVKMHVIEATLCGFDGKSHQLRDKT